MPATFGTDIGPKCSRCNGTIWGYEFTRYGVATCAGCHMTEGPLRLRAGGKVLPVPTTAEEARAMHEGFRAPGFKLRPGYGFMATFEDESADFRTVDNDAWEIVILPHTIDDQAPEFLGLRDIDGASCAVFRGCDGTLYAQTAVYAAVKPASTERCSRCGRAFHTDDYVKIATDGALICGACENKEG